MIKLSKRESGQQNRLHDQLDFFGAKKKRFISVYARKPRIRLKVETPSNIDKFRVDKLYGFGYSDPIGCRAGLRQAAARQALLQSETVIYDSIFGSSQQLAMGSFGGLGGAGLANQLAAQGALYGRRLY